jgi:hypothetical protein
MDGSPLLSRGSESRQAAWEGGGSGGIVGAQRSVASPNVWYGSQKCVSALLPKAETTVSVWCGSAISDAREMKEAATAAASVLPVSIRHSTQPGALRSFRLSIYDGFRNFGQRSIGLLFFL